MPLVVQVLCIEFTRFWPAGIESEVIGIRRSGRDWEVNLWDLAVWAAGRPGVGRRAVVCHSAGLGGLSFHSPLLATDIMLLYCVAKEGSTGSSNDPGSPGIHVEGVRES